MPATRTSGSRCPPSGCRCASSSRAGRPKGDAPGPAGVDDRPNRPGRLELHEPRGDVQDLYRERIEKGRARRGNGSSRSASGRRRSSFVAAREKLVVRSTSNGPLLEGDLAVRWTALDPSNLRVPNADFLRAGDEATFLATFDRFTGPPQNVVWASASGSIGWRPAGLLPVRRAGTDGSVPYDASDPENAWRGYVPMEELPRVVDPPAGFVVTANQRTIGTSFGHVVSSDWGHPAGPEDPRPASGARPREGR
ncbi:MAG: penicillin acylase family protein [Holophagales bacterium]|nr:penicillin acylase family protein [Holophagales bacterium]